MEFLKHIDISGEIFRAHAIILAEYEFNLADDDSSAAVFVFSLPRDAMITSVNIMNENRCMMQIDICGIDAADALYGGIRITRLNPYVYKLETNTASPNRPMGMLLKMIVPLKMHNGKTELCFPSGLGGDFAHYRRQSCKTELSLKTSLTEMCCSSATHSVKSEKSSAEAVFSLSTDTGRDIILSFFGSEQRSLGAVSDGIAFYRLVSNTREAYCTNDTDKILLLADFAKSNGLSEANLVKELILRTAQETENGKKLQIRINGEELFDRYMPKSDALCDKLLNILSLNEDFYGNIYDFFCVNQNFDDTDIIFITSSSDAPRELRYHLADFKNEISVFSVGTHISDFGFFSELNGIKYHEHFYPQDIMSENARFALMHAKAQSETIIGAVDSCVPEILRLTDSGMYSDGFEDIVTRFAGLPPHTFTLGKDGRKIENISVVDIKPFFDTYTAGLIYAAAKIKSLGKLLRSASPDTCFRIKNEIKKLASKYKLLTSETLLTVKNADSVPLCIPISFYTIGAKMPEVDKTVFGERNADFNLNQHQTAKLVKVCTDILKSAIKSDGSIADFDTVGSTQKLTETIYSAAALKLTLYKGTAECPEFAFKLAEGARLYGLASRLYLHRTALSDFFEKYRNDILDELPEYRLLLSQLNDGKNAISAAAQLILRLFADGKISR